VQKVTGVVACVAFASACSATTGQTIVSTSIAPCAGPSATGELLLRVSSDEPVDLERYDAGEGHWKLFCSTPCEERTPTEGVYRVIVGSSPSRAFRISGEADSWMVLQIDPEGRVWTRDSPTLRRQQGAGKSSDAAALRPTFVATWFNLLMRSIARL
jgi:hypothetical protein